MRSGPGTFIQLKAVTADPCKDAATRDTRAFCHHSAEYAAFPRLWPLFARFQNRPLRRQGNMGKISTCAFRWSSGKPVRHIALAITLARILLYSDLVSAIFPKVSDTNRFLTCSSNS